MYSSMHGRIAKDYRSPIPASNELAGKLGGYLSGFMLIRQIPAIADFIKD